MEGTIQIHIPSVIEITQEGIPIHLARRGESWSQAQLKEFTRKQGVYVLHQSGTVLYVGKTDGPTMTFGVRLRREFQETASGGRHIYPKLIQLPSDPIRVSFVPLERIQTLVECQEVVLAGCGKTPPRNLFETLAR